MTNIHILIVFIIISKAFVKSSSSFQELFYLIFISMLILLLCLTNSPLLLLTSRYYCSNWEVTKCIEKRLECLLFEMNSESSTLQSCYCTTTFILPTIQVKQAIHAGHCWKIIMNSYDILLWTPTHGHTSVGWSAKIYIQ